MTVRQTLIPQAVRVGKPKIGHTAGIQTVIPASLSAFPRRIYWCDMVSPLMGSKRRFAVLQCEDLPKWKHGDLLWEQLLGEPGDEWVSYHCCSGEFPVASDGVFDGYVISGSHYMATEFAQHPWMKTLFEFIATGLERQHKMFGACFGHQAAALALGGTVARNPAPGQFVYGVHEAVWSNDALHQDYVMAALGSNTETPPPVRIMKSHGQQVVDLPSGATVLASSEACAIEMFQFGTFLGFQGHPELTAIHLRSLIEPAILDSGTISEQQAQQAETTFAKHVANQQSSLHAQSCNYCEALATVPIQIDFYGDRGATLARGKHPCAEPRSHQILRRIIRSFLDA